MTSTRKDAVASPINLRLLFEDAKEGEIGAWEERLRHGGVTVLGRSNRALEVEGPQELLQEILSVEITNEDNSPSIKDRVQKGTPEAEGRPLIYAPRRPTYFKKE